jgi:hypothetical protein
MKNELIDFDPFDNGEDELRQRISYNLKRLNKKELKTVEKLVYDLSKDTITDFEFGTIITSID